MEQIKYEQIGPGFYQLFDVFPEYQIQEFIKTTTVIEPRKWEAFTEREQKRRAWDTQICSPIEFKGIAEELAEKKLWLSDTLLWVDREGFKLDLHKDRNTNVAVSVQVYLDDGPEEIGTWCEDMFVPYQRNTGYLLIDGRNRLHGMKTEVPEGVFRRSFYCYFRDQEQPDQTSVRGGEQKNPDGFFVITNGTERRDHPAHLDIPNGWVKSY